MASAPHLPNPPDTRKCLMYGLLAFTLVCYGCAAPNPSGTLGGGDCPWQKLDFSLSLLDSAGLVGPADGKVALDFEFCLPMRADYKKAVVALDSTLAFQATPHGGCGEGYWLVVGNTHQKPYRKIFCAVARLDGVGAIRRVFWE